MSDIMPCLWFDTQGQEAAEFYVSVFENSRVGTVMRFDEASAEASGQPEGSVLTVEFELDGHDFMALNGGPNFNFTPAVSFFVSCDSADEIDELFETLSDGGAVLMPLQEYPFSERYGWLSDRYGVSWQLNLAPSQEKITPSLMFVGEQHGKAEEAMRLYTSLFENSGVGTIARYGPDDPDPAEGTVKYAEFSLDGQQFRAMDSSLQHDFGFTEAISLHVSCGNQDEVDHFWEGLTEAGEEGRCGWLKDEYGVSWQIVPTVLNEMLQDEDAERAGRVMRAMLPMKKLDIRRLEEAYEGA